MLDLSGRIDPTIPSERVERAGAERKILLSIQALSAKPETIAAALPGIAEQIRSFNQSYGASRPIYDRMRQLFLSPGSPEEPFLQHWLPLERDLGTGDLRSLLGRVSLDGPAVKRLSAILSAGSGLTADELGYLSLVLGAIGPAGTDPNLKAVAETVRDAFSARLDALEAKPKLSPKDVYRALEDALSFAKAERALGSADESKTVEARLEELLVFSDTFGKAPEVARAWFAGRPNATSPEIEQAAKTLAARHGGALSLADVRVLAARIDANGARDEEELRALKRIQKLPVAPEAEAAKAKLLAGLTTEADLYTPAAPSGAKPLAWSKENSASSDGQVTEVELPTPTQGPGTLEFPWFRIHTEVPATALLGQAPDAAGDGATQAAFDVVEVATQVHGVLAELERLGFPPTDWMQRPIDIYPQRYGDMNADYDPSSRSLSFGTSLGAWRTASDGDVVVHELGHMILDHLCPGLLVSAEGAAIHEGMADAFAAVFHGDPEIAEDASELTGNSAGFRSAKNDADLGFAGDEAHARGEVYAGLSWDICQDLGRDQGLKLIIATGALLDAAAASPGAFVRAMERAIKEVLPPEAQAGAQLTLMRSASRRGLLDGGQSAVQREERAAARVAESLGLKLSSPTAAALVEVLNAKLPSTGDLPAAKFVPAGTVHLPSGLTRITFGLSDPSGSARSERSFFAELGVDGRLTAISPDLEAKAAWSILNAEALPGVSAASLGPVLKNALQEASQTDNDPANRAAYAGLLTQVSAGNFTAKPILIRGKLEEGSAEAAIFGRSAFLAGVEIQIGAGAGAEGGASLQLTLGGSDSVAAAHFTAESGPAFLPRLASDGPLVHRLDLRTAQLQVVARSFVHQG
ncbi:MAG: hypothetical protein U1E65_06240 [Myxococcota bacterium]